METKGKVKSKGLPTIAKVGFGCLLVFIILAIVGGLLANLIFKKVVQTAIQNKTGLQTNLTDIQNGKFSFTDPKTGAKLDIGGGKIPDNFPKDFPIYPGSKVASALSGDQQQNGSGFWLTLTTTDSVDAVTKFYTTNLKAQGWSVKESTSTTTPGVNWAVSKDNLNGLLAFDRPKDQEVTTILIILGASK